MCGTSSGGFDIVSARDMTSTDERTSLLCEGRDDQNTRKSWRDEHKTIWLLVSSLLACAILGLAAHAGFGRGGDASGPGSPQTSTVLKSQDAKMVRTVQFNPCRGTIQMTGELSDSCTVRSSECLYCAWVKPFDSEYRITDIVQLRSQAAQLMAQAVWEKPMYRGTILQRMLSSYPKDPSTGDIIFPGPKAREQLKEQIALNTAFVERNLARKSCTLSGPGTLLVHIRAGDNGELTDRRVDIASATKMMTSYISKHPEIRRIELSTMLHFGVLPPDDPFYTKPGRYKFEQKRNADGSVGGPSTENSHQ